MALFLININWLLKKILRIHGEQVNWPAFLLKKQIKKTFRNSERFFSVL
jgi:hypothetical protein